MTEKKKGLILAFIIYLIQVPILLGSIYGWLLVHPIVIIPPVLGLINTKVEKRGIEGLGLTLPYPLRSLLLALILTAFKALIFTHIFTVSEITLSFPAINIKIFFSLIKEFVIAVFIIAMWEEFASRGYIQTRLQEAWGFLGVILSALMFASLHIPSAILQFNFEPQMVFLNFLEMFIPGFMLSFIYWKTRSTLTTIAVHGFRNFLFVVVLSYSGLSAKELHMLQPGIQILWSVVGVLLVLVLLRLIFPGEHKSQNINSDEKQAA